VFPLALVACTAEPPAPTVVIPPLVITEHDRDGDGLLDVDEGEHHTHSGKADTDGDGLPDGFEVLTSHTNPRDPDTDRDGISDYDEVMDPSLDPLRKAVVPAIPPGLSQPPDAWRCATRQKPNCYVMVTGSTFLMGAQSTHPDAEGFDRDAGPNESPPHRVTLDPYWINQTEVTAGLFKKCVRAGACQPSDVATGGLFNHDVPARSEHPINGITWSGASGLCGWLGGRLPTEAEWELAARGTDGRRFPWGDEPGCGTTSANAFIEHARRKMNRGPCENTGTAESFNVWFQSPANTVGMAGNVWEWTADVYAPYTSGDATNPTGPSQGDQRVQRGGGWSSTEPEALRSAARASLDPSLKLPDVGFRCVWRPQ